MGSEETRNAMLPQNRSHLAKLFTLVLFVTPAVSASEWAPLSGIYYDNHTHLGVTAGAARIGERTERGDFPGYYADVTYGQRAMMFSMGMVSLGESGLLRGGVAFLRTDIDGRREEFVGLVNAFSTNSLVSIRLGLFIQTANMEDVRGLAGIGLGF